MPKTDQSGFTLIEIMMVLAITSVMLLMVWAGQAQIRSRAQFDAAVNQVMESVAAARDQATAGINTSTGANAGTGLTACSGGGSGQYIFAGVDWVADSSASAGVSMHYDSYEALPGSVACIFSTQAVHLPVTGVSVKVGTNTTGGQELFVRTAGGGVLACPMTGVSTPPSNAAAVLSAFKGGSCPVGTPASLSLIITDSYNHQATVVIDQSGLAKRQD